MKVKFDDKNCNLTIIDETNATTIGASKIAAMSGLLAMISVYYL